MAVTYSTRNDYTNTGGSPTVSEPAGAASGNALLGVYICDAGGAPTLPTGWTSLYNGTQGSVTWRVGYIIRGGSAPSYTFTHTGSIYYELSVQLFVGAAAITLDSQSASGTTGNSATLPNPPATTAVASTSLAVCSGLNYGGWSGAPVAPTGYTLRYGAGGLDFATATKALAAAGSEDPAAFGGTLASGDWWHGFTITFTDAGGGGSPTVKTLAALGVG